MNETTPGAPVEGNTVKDATETKTANQIVSEKIEDALISFVRGIHSVESYIKATERTVLLKDMDDLIEYYRKRLHSVELEAESGDEKAVQYVENIKGRLKNLNDRRRRVAKGATSSSSDEKEVYEKHIIINNRVFLCDPNILPSSNSSFSFSQFKSFELLYRSSVIQIISAYEMLISNIMHAYYREYPGSLNKKEVTVTLDEIKKYDTLEEYLQYIIDEEVESFMMQSLEKWSAFFSGMKIDFKSMALNWADFTEHFYRRNIIVHNDGIVNKRYLKNLELVGLKSEYKEGDKVSVGYKYTSRMIEDVLIAGISFALHVWQKFEKTSVDRVALIHDLTYSSLMRKHWRLSEKLSNLLDFFTDDPEEQLVGNMNRVLSIKRQGRTDEAKRMLSRFSHSTHHPKYSAVAYSLLDEKDKFFSVLPKTDLELASLI